MTDFSAEERALDCCADLDGHLELVTDDDGNDCVPSGAVDIIRGYIDRAFEAGRASRDAEVAELRAGLEKAQANYQFMVERACDEKLDGYRELGTRLATSEQARDSLRAQLAEKDAELARLKAIQPEFDRLRELEKACLLELGTRDPGVIRDYAQELSRHRYARGPFAKGPANAQ